jgi:hypothetical protein
MSHGCGYPYCGGTAPECATCGKQQAEPVAWRQWSTKWNDWDYQTDPAGLRSDCPKEPLYATAAAPVEAVEWLRTAHAAMVTALDSLTTYGRDDAAVEARGSINEARSAISHAVRVLGTEPPSQPRKHGRDELIAELLNALAPCVEYGGGQCLGDHPEKLAQARAAIAKAAGEAA